jgi:hypothetical protein
MSSNTVCAIAKVVITRIHVNRMARLEGNIGECAGEGNVTVIGSAGCWLMGLPSMSPTYLNASLNTEGLNSYWLIANVF